MEKYKFRNPQAYLAIINDLEKLVKNDSFEIVGQTCDFVEVKSEKGWYSDIICHIIQCKACGSCYECSCDTYHGNGVFVRRNKNNGNVQYKK